MTRKDYVAIAKAINSALWHHECDPATVVMVAGELSTVLHKDNPLFDDKRFMEACTAKKTV